MHGGMILLFFSLGCAALAVWTLARYPEMGPRRPVGGVVAVVALLGGKKVAGTLFDAIVALGQYGVALALLVVVLPALTAAFWVSGCVLRTLAETPGLHR